MFNGAHFEIEPFIFLVISYHLCNLSNHNSVMIIIVNLILLHQQVQNYIQHHNIQLVNNLVCHQEWPHLVMNHYQLLKPFQVEMIV